jgi:hypothetical protein
VQVVEFSLARRIWWQVEDFPQLIKIKDKELEGVKLINPLFYRYMEENSPPSIYDGGRSHIVKDEEGVLVSSQILCFVIEEKTNVHTLLGFVGQLLQRLRWISKQSMINEKIDLYSKFQLTELPEIDVEQAEGRWSSNQAHMLKTVITHAHIKKALRLIDVSVPIHATVLLDAIEAFHQRNYKTAILYSAFAMDVAARKLIDAEYQKQIKRKKPSSFLRIEARGSDKSTIKIEDAIYTNLTQNGRFKEWLHEIPLYLLRRSLRFDNNALYANATKLYEIRNGFVHKGSYEKTDNPFTIDRQGAIKAMICAEDVINWLGDKDIYYSKIMSKSPDLEHRLRY